MGSLTSSFVNSVCIFINIIKSILAIASSLHAYSPFPHFPQHTLFACFTQAILHTLCLHFSRDDWKSQEKLKTMLMQNCLRLLGCKKQANKVYYGKCKMATALHRLIQVNPRHPNVVLDSGLEAVESELQVLNSSLSSQWNLDPGFQS